MNADPIDPAPSPGASLSGDALAESAERYASLFIHHPHAAYSVDCRGYYTDANPRALEMTGLTLEQMRSTHFAEVIHPDDVRLMQDGFDRALTGEPQVLEARVLRVDGEIVDIRCTAIPILVGNEVVGVHGITEDVTADKHLVRQLREANAAKTLFLATVSHEVRTPLATLVGATDLLMESELDPEPEHFAHMVHRSGQRLVRLVNDILEFSGLEANQTMVQSRPFDVRALIDDIADWAVPYAESCQLRISFQVDGSVPTTSVGDGLRVSQVVTNLVSNAIKFTEHGSIDLRVTSHSVPPHVHPDRPGTDHWIEFAVTDTGVGIAEHRLGDLFEPFTRMDPANAEPRRGIGLGLAICRELVDLMGGQLRVSTAVGEGSTFTFATPLGLSTEANAAGPSAG